MDTDRVAEQQLGIILAAIQVLAHHGVLACDQSSDAATLWIRPEASDVDRLGRRADTTGMMRVREVAHCDESSVAAVWERGRKGAFIAYRIERARKQRDRRLAPAHPCDAVPPVHPRLPSAQGMAALAHGPATGDGRRATEVDVAVHPLNHMLEPGRPIPVRIA